MCKTTLNNKINESVNLEEKKKTTKALKTKQAYVTVKDSHDLADLW